MGLLAAGVMLLSATGSAYSEGGEQDARIQANAPTRILNSDDEAGEVKPDAESMGPQEAAKTKASAGDSPVIARPVAPAGRRVDRTHSAPTTADGPALLQMMWPLFVVLGVVGGLTYAVRRWMPKSMRTSGAGALQVLARQPLNGKQSLCLVRIGKRLVLMGVTPEHISTLTEITDREESAEIMAAIESSRPSSFAKTFGNLTDAELKAADDEESGVVYNAESLNDAPLSTGELVQTRERVRGLLDRVRNIAGELARPSAESASKAAAGR